MQLIRKLLGHWRLLEQLRAAGSGMTSRHGLSMNLHGSVDARLHAVRSQFPAPNRASANVPPPAAEPHPQPETPSAAETGNGGVMDVRRKVELIRTHAGQTFRTKTGVPFTYELIGEAIRPDRTNYRIPLSDFCRALELVPFDRPEVINHIIQCPSYVWAIVHDRRISEGHW
jgi:hypothetical protein